MGKRRANMPINFDDNSTNIELEDVRLSKRAFEIVSKNEESKKRYSSFKQSKIDSNKLKKFILNKYDITISDISSTIIGSMSKVFIGELVETARIMMTEDGIDGSIKKKYLRLAFTKLIKQFDDLYLDNEYFCR